MNPGLKARTVGASGFDWAGVVGEMSKDERRRSTGLNVALLTSAFALSPALVDGQSWYSWWD